MEKRLEADSSTSTRALDYTYDAIGRLTREGSTSNVNSAESYTWVYGYDRAGNRTVKWNGAIEYWRDYAYDANDRLTQEVYGGIDYTEQVDYGYDANGSLISRDRSYSNSGEYVGEREQTNEERTYGHDLRNRLVSFEATELRETDPEFDGFSLTRTTETAATYTYHHDGIRVGSDTSTTVTDHTTNPDTVTPTTDERVFLVDGTNPTGYAQVLEEKATPSSSPTVTYVIGDDVIGQANSSGTLAYLVYDGHGSTRLLTTATGTITERYAFDAFGLGLAHNPGTTGTDFLFAGEQLDSGLGQYYLRARYYDQSVGRFSSFDDFEANASEPTHLHKYLYAGSNPVGAIDPSGYDFSALSAQAATSIQNIIASTYLIAATAFLATARGVADGLTANQILVGFYVDWLLEPVDVVVETTAAFIDLTQKGYVFVMTRTGLYEAEPPSSQEHSQASLAGPAFGTFLLGLYNRVRRPASIYEAHHLNQRGVWRDHLPENSASISLTKDQHRTVEREMRAFYAEARRSDRTPTVNQYNDAMEAALRKAVNDPNAVRQAVKLMKAEQLGAGFPGTKFIPRVRLR
ncbi:MAG: RHS repeat-associated core domain-containing protein [Tepidisphaeraceae bacterium]